MDKDLMEVKVMGIVVDPKASVGHPPVSEIRRSMVDQSLKGFLSGVTHSSSDAIVHGYGRRRPQPTPCLHAVALRRASVVSCAGG